MMEIPGLPVMEIPGLPVMEIPGLPVMEISTWLVVLEHVATIVLECCNQELPHGYQV